MLFALLDRGVIRIALDVQGEQTELRTLMHRYRNRPMSLADACLVRLARWALRRHGACLLVKERGPDSPTVVY